MIQYSPREKTRSEETLQQLLNLGWPLDPAKTIQKDAASIANAMRSIHGGDWRIQIDHQGGFVMIVRH